MNKKEVKRSYFKEITPIYVVGTLLQVQEEYKDIICLLSVPNAAAEPKNFLKAKDSKYMTMISIKSGDIVYYLGTYRNKVKGKMCTYHRFLYEKTVVYAFDDSFMEDFGTYFLILCE